MRKYFSKALNWEAQSQILSSNYELVICLTLFYHWVLGELSRVGSELVRTKRKKSRKRELERLTVPICLHLAQSGSQEGFSRPDFTASGVCPDLIQIPLWASRGTGASIHVWFIQQPQEHLSNVSTRKQRRFLDNVNKANTRKHLPAQVLLLLPVGTSRTKGLGAEVVGDILAGGSHTANDTFTA